MNRPFFQLLLSVVLLAGGGLAAVSASAATEYFPLWQKSPPNITDLALIYQGGRQRPQWTTNRFAPYVSYRDPQSGKEQWLFDGFLFIEFQDGNGHAYEPGLRLAPAEKTNWLWLLERNFATNDGLPMLEQTCRDTAGRIGQPQRRRQVLITVPSPLSGQTNWGELQGRALDFRQPADRLAACEWYLQTAMEKWQALAPRQLDLAGFYWLHESVAPDADLLPQVAKAVHRLGKQFFWIPYWHASHAPTNWHALGFDIAWQQPNHFFHPELPDSRLQQACDFARRCGMGMEMEFDARLISRPEVFAPRLDAYLDAFTRNGVAETAAIAWYEGGGTIYQLATSDQPELRRKYDRLGQFVLRRQQMADELSRR